MEEILKFLDDVLHNNNRPWFQEHKKQYQQAQANFNALDEQIIAGVQNDCLRHTHRFLYSLDGHTFLPAGEPFAMLGGYWKGIRVALFCYGNSGLARFDSFHRNDLTTSPEQ